MTTTNSLSRALVKLTGINHKLSTAYHPQTDGSSEQLNKTIVRCLHFHIKWNQRGWVKVLPKVRFNMMNMPNGSMGVSPFVLKTRCSPWLLPPLVIPPATTEDPNVAPHEVEAQAFMETMEEETNVAKDSLLTAKIQQVHFTNKDCVSNPAFHIGNKVMLAMANRWRDYIHAKDGHVAKFMP